MFIVTTNPCGCDPWHESKDGKFEHYHSDCPIARFNREIKRKIDKRLKEFKREVEQ